MHNDKNKKRAGNNPALFYLARDASVVNELVSFTNEVCADCVENQD